MRHLPEHAFQNLSGIMTIMFLPPLCLQYCRDQAEAMSNQYENVLYLPIPDSEGSAVEVFQRKLEWERKLLECIYLLPEMHPCFQFEAETDPYSPRTPARRDGSEPSMKWDRARMTPEEIRAESDVLRRAQRWILAYYVIDPGQDERAGKGWLEEKASIESLLQPLAEAESRKRKDGGRGRVIDFKFFKNASLAVQDLQAADKFRTLLDSARGSQEAMDHIRRVLWDIGIKLDAEKASLRIALPGDMLQRG